MSLQNTEDNTNMMAVTLRPSSGRRPDTDVSLKVVVCTFLVLFGLLFVHGSSRNSGYQHLDTNAAELPAELHGARLKMVQVVFR